MRRPTTSGLTALAAAAGLLLLPRLAVAAPDVAVWMSVSPQVPTPGQTVEFTITARNDGTSDAFGVVVANTLPAGLAAAPGLAPFPSTGWYEPATGRWTIGTLARGASAELVLPVVVATTSQPPCLVAVARSELAGDIEDSNNRAAAAVKRTADDRCVDLRFRAPALRPSGCGGTLFALYSVTLVNEGPDAAHDVLVDLSQAQPALPNVVFFGDDCAGTRCSIPMVPAGTRRTFEAGSDAFENPAGRTVTITVAASSSDYEYASDDNQRTDPLWIDASPKCNEGLAIGLSGCFIATAAYGSPLEPHVQVLRDFRDRHLRRSAAGRALIELYYRYSPPVAVVIARHASLRLVTRALLTPLVFAIEFPAQGATVVALILLGGFLGGRRVLRSRA
ncbi:MAG TPA: DUF11 domain-containing protein [Steroidobacteraceae bacterium]|nr:DUF11 domain-containing protein [Steroidobacteraceae bacterium]